MVRNRMKYCLKWGEGVPEYCLKWGEGVPEFYHYGLPFRRGCLWCMPFVDFTITAFLFAAVVYGVCRL